MACKTCDYKELVKSASLAQIKNAWKKADKATEIEISLSFERLAICNHCEHKEKLNPFLAALQNILSEETRVRHKDLVEFSCKICKCPLVQKSYIEENATEGRCPLGKW